MFRKIMLAVAVLVGGATLSATDASAGYRHGGYGYNSGVSIKIGFGNGYHGGYNRGHYGNRFYGGNRYYGGRRFYGGNRYHGRRYYGGGYGKRFYGHYRPSKIVVKHVYHSGYGRGGYGYY